MYSIIIVNYHFYVGIFGHKIGHNQAKIMAMPKRHKFLAESAQACRLLGTLQFFGIRACALKVLNCN